MGRVNIWSKLYILENTGLDKLGGIDLKWWIKQKGVSKVEQDDCSKICRAQMEVQ